MENDSTENGQYILKMSREGLLKFCPKCRAPITKISGCNKMYCTKCMCTWCWLCGDTGIDYDHFNLRKGKPCANKLWEGVDTDFIEDNIPNVIVPNVIVPPIDIDNPEWNEPNIMIEQPRFPQRPPIINR